MFVVLNFPYVGYINTHITLCSLSNIVLPFLKKAKSVLCYVMNWTREVDHYSGTVEKEYDCADV